MCNYSVLVLTIVFSWFERNSVIEFAGGERHMEDTMKSGSSLSPSVLDNIIRHINFRIRYKLLMLTYSLVHVLSK